jgi:hypothetical protein
MKISSQDGEDIIGEKEGGSISTVILHFTRFNLYTSVNAIELKLITIFIWIHSRSKSLIYSFYPISMWYQLFVIFFPGESLLLLNL